MEGEAEGHHMGVVPGEFQGGGVLRQGIQVHGEKIHRELTVNVVELIFVPAEILFEVVAVHFLEVAKVVGAFGVDAFMEDEVLAFFFGNECVGAVWAAQLHGREAAFIRGKACTADLAEELAFGAIVLVEEGLRGIAAGAGTGVRDGALGAAADGADFLAVAFFVVGDKLPVSPVLPEVGDQGEGIGLELLVLRGMGIIESPLPEGEIPADKI